ncbi:MAG: hypothetical protein HYR55_03085 [Acidobacteria bacterium]|nr:hypothetical protein [Acidobacteriota bacterium]
MIYGCGGGSKGTPAVVPPPPPPPQACTSLTTLTSSSRLKISVQVNGIYVITPDSLKQSCFDPSGISLQNFALQNFDPNTNTKQFIPIPVHFDLQGNLEFYGVGVNRNDYTSPNADYTENNVYWLVPAATTPQILMSSKTASTGGTPISPMTTLHQEKNNLYTPDMINGAGYDHWFWDQLLPSGGSLVYPSPIYQFTVNNYDSQYPDTPSLTIYFQSLVSTPHNVSVISPALANSTVAWNTTTQYRFSSSFSASLSNGVNALQLTDNGDKVYLNWFELEYPAKAYNDQLTFHGNVSTTQPYSFSINGFSQQNSIELFDISNPQSPLIISNYSIAPVSGGGYQMTFSDNLTAQTSNSYIALTPAQRITPGQGSIVLVNSADLKGITGGYNYLVISHENFLTNIQPLVNYRMTTGGSYSVYVAKIGDVYDSYSGGIFTPQAIKDFISDVYSRWPLQYVLLVGDASVDYKNYLNVFGYNQDNYIPTFLQDYFYGQTPSDYWFVPQRGSPFSWPLIAIGRFPAKTGTEVDTMVNKVINYKKPTSVAWNKNALFVAADTFDTNSENLINNIGNTLNLNMFRNYYSTTAASTLSITYFSDSNLMASSIINNINSGAVITNYVGHGSVEIWGNGANQSITNPFFNSSYAKNLNNSNQLTFLITLDCLNGYFAGFGEGLYNPIYGRNNPYSLSEVILNSTSGGAIASFSPTGQGYTSNHITLATALYQSLLVNSPPSVGQAIQQAERTVLLSGSASSQDFETVQIFVLLGDPATQLAVP